jgi:hypothetical protein
MATARQRARRHKRRAHHAQADDRARTQKAWRAMTPEAQAALSGNRPDERRGDITGERLL